MCDILQVGVTDDAGALCRCAARFVRLLLSMVESAAFCELACKARDADSRRLSADAPAAQPAE